MADTLLGYHHKRACKECGYTNWVNASAEADPQGREPEPVVAFRCENCGHWETIQEIRAPQPQQQPPPQPPGGDR